MAARGHMPPGYGGRSDQAPGMMRHGPFPAANRTLETLPPELLDNKLAVQEAEIERLAGDNHRLASTHVALRHDLVASQQDIQRLRAHIRSIQTEADIRIRVLLEKIAKMEAELSAGESIKKDLQQAHIEAQGLLKTNQELNGRIQQANQELENARADIKRLPEMLSELESMKEEHQRLRTTFEYEKGWNIEKVEKMKVMEKDLVGMSRELENLRAQVANAERRARVPNQYGGPYMNQDPLYPPPPHMHNPGGYVDSYSRPMQMSIGASGEMMLPYGVGNATPTSNVGGAAFPGSAGGAFDHSHGLR